MSKFSRYQNRLLAVLFALTLFVTGCITNLSKIEPQLVLSGHSKPITDVAFSPDGKTLASVSVDDGSIRLWSSETGEMISFLRSPEPNKVAFSPDGTIFATSGTNALVTIWDSETASRLETLDAHSNPPIQGTYGSYQPWLNGLEFSPDGRFLLTIEVGPNVDFSNDYQMSLWDTQTWQLVQRWNETGGGFTFSPDGSTLIVTTGELFANCYFMWSLESQEEVDVLESCNFLKFSYSASGEILVGWRSGYEELYFFDPATGKKLSTLPLVGKDFSNVRFTTDGQRLITGDCEDTLNLWDASDGTHLAQIKLSPSVRWQKCLIPNISPDGSLLATRDENSINIWALPEEFR